MARGFIYLRRPPQTGLVNTSTDDLGALRTYAFYVTTAPGRCPFWLSLPFPQKPFLKSALANHHELCEMRTYTLLRNEVLLANFNRC